jgi:AraC family transcriptional regulator, regulatory protein of adaptative response / DNA-3-methyladenine glycosylase II
VPTIVMAEIRERRQRRGGRLCTMLDDPDRCYAALQARDPRFDGWFVVGVTSTGIYCRPSCPALTPRRDRVRFLATAAAAQRAGFRACKRCRPDASPGSPAWDHRADLVARAMRLIADGVVDRDGVSGLAARLGYSVRHLNRQLVDEVGAGPLALARAQRAQAARVLIETTDLAFAEVAFAAGFGSVRQFNDAVREVFATTPTVLRDRAGRGDVGGGEVVRLRLAHRRPSSMQPVFRHLAARAVPGLECLVAPARYRRSLRLPHGSGIVELATDPGEDRSVAARLQVTDLRDLSTAVQRCRRLLDLDADPIAVDERLAADPVMGRLVDAVPGMRVPHSVDPFEAAVRIVLGQQISVAGARRFAQRLVARFGDPVDRPWDGVTTRFPAAATLVGADLEAIGVTRRRAATIRILATAVASGDLDLDVGADRGATMAALGHLPGVGPWTVQQIALRALGDPDAFPATDLVLRQAADSLGLPSGAAGLTAHASAWRPWRAVAAQHLWNHAAATSRRAA